MTTREVILAEIRRLAARDNKSPGSQSFETETGIKQSEWRGKFWRSWSAALIEAELTPNEFQSKISSEVVLTHFIEAIRHFGRIPAMVDIRMYSREAKGFPSHSVFLNHFNGKNGLLEALSIFVGSKFEFEDIALLLPNVAPAIATRGLRADGYVYLLKSGPHFKIGRSDEIERRLKQITVALPDSVVLVHTIRTDDPSGIEAYWHTRFSDKRANGEWFRLSVEDIRVFKRRKFQ